MPAFLYNPLTLNSFVAFRRYCVVTVIPALCLSVPIDPTTLIDPAPTGAFDGTLTESV